ncbi:tyrosine-protein phosphatase [Bacillus alkalisoli]|uniref:tyrosine-protein phosphatase n=1 Tax=Bacillus alkalisoli TaxID=2011008 RepID=UPI000C23A4BA|nr:CpsB/CapC family capsule biosynthesis tyrosine phosphatase [Bacillus alkalisoli]
MIDIHCHILPSLDDGASHMTESVEMAREAVKQGITTIVATPHHLNGSFENDKTTILNKVIELNERLAKEGIDLTILPGQECRIIGELVAEYNKGSILTANDKGKYIFIELPSNSVPLYTEKLLFDLQLNGLIPVIVHPERNAEFISNPDKLYQLVKKGACTQITASSLVGKFGKNIKKFTHNLIEANLTHFIASDAHNIKTRSFFLAEAYEEIEAKYGKSIRYMFMENAELLVEGETIYKEAPERVKKKKLFGIF